MIRPLMACSIVSHIQELISQIFHPQTNGTAQGTVQGQVPAPKTLWYADNRTWDQTQTFGLTADRLYNSAIATSLQIMRLQ